MILIQNSQLKQNKNSFIVVLCWITRYKCAFIIFNVCLGFIEVLWTLIVYLLRHVIIAKFNFFFLVHTKIYLHNTSLPCIEIGPKKYSSISFKLFIFLKSRKILQNTSFPIFYFHMSKRYNNTLVKKNYIIILCHIFLFFFSKKEKYDILNLIIVGITTSDSYYERIF
jgi:hypothetical protein